MKGGAEMYPATFLDAGKDGTIGNSTIKHAYCKRYMKHQYAYYSEKQNFIYAYYRSKKELLLAHSRKSCYYDRKVFMKGMESD